MSPLPGGHLPAHFSVLKGFDDYVNCPTFTFYNRPSPEPQLLQREEEEEEEEVGRREDLQPSDEQAANQRRCLDVSDDAVSLFYSTYF